VAYVLQSFLIPGYPPFAQADSKDIKDLPQGKPGKEMAK
jgi:hypothetical protein